MTVESDKYRAEVYGGLLKVWAKEPPVLVKTTWDNNGVEHSERQILSKSFPKTPVFAATYEGNDSCEIDLDCGFKRWHGSKSLDDVEKALNNCGFALGHISDLIEEMCTVEQSCPSWR